MASRVQGQRARFKIQSWVLLMILPFTIQIPVFNETTALEFSTFYFARLGVEVRYIMDTQRTPEAEVVFKRLGLKPLYFDNDMPFIENGYENFASMSPTDWILRLDCDEVPSPDLINYCATFIEQGHEGVAGFERHQVYWNDGRFFTATNDRFQPSAQKQWRLFNRTKVDFNRNIHTPGIHVVDPEKAPSGADIYHLSWVFLSWEDRLKKAARYDSHGQPEYTRQNQLFPLNEVVWEELDAPDLRDAYAAWLAMTNG